MENGVAVRQALGEAILIIFVVLMAIFVAALLRGRRRP